MEPVGGGTACWVTRELALPDRLYSGRTNNPNDNVTWPVLLICHFVSPQCGQTKLVVNEEGSRYANVVFICQFAHLISILKFDLFR